jgi:hypothetical protein
MKIRNKKTGQIIEYSARASRIRRMQKRIKAWSDVIKPYLDKVGKSKRLVMITLTYEKIGDWRPGHIREFMLKLRKVLRKNINAYAWVAENQMRGAVHYHVILLVEKGTNIPMPDKDGLWVHGSSRIETARSPYYILSYAGKEYQKVGIFPKGLRMFAVWISPEVVSGITRWFFRLSTFPVWLVVEVLKNSMFGVKIRRAVGGGWEVGGTIYKSPWEVIEYG